MASLRAWTVAGTPSSRASAVPIVDLVQRSAARFGGASCPLRETTTLPAANSAAPDSPSPADPARCRRLPSSGGHARGHQYVGRGAVGEPVFDGPH